MEWYEGMNSERIICTRDPKTAVDDYEYALFPIKSQGIVEV